VDPSDAAHVLTTPEEYARFLSALSFDKRVEMLNAFRCAELQGAEELRVLADTVDDPDLAAKFSRHAADDEKHGAYFGEIMRRLVSFEAHRQSFEAAERLRDGGALPPA
jgi:hypothetical protein